MDRAADVRAIADTCKMPEIKTQLEACAQQYDHLALSVRSGALGR